MVLLLGCDHYLQEYELQDCQEEIRNIERGLKQKFYDLTAELVRAHRITFIGEECKPQQRTIPRALAEEHGCRYAEIDMSAAERERRGIPNNYERLGNAEQLRCSGLREEYMVWRTYTESTTEASKLVVCGALHLEGLAARFREHESYVTTRNLLKEEWCVFPWEKMMRGEL